MVRNHKNEENNDGWKIAAGIAVGVGVGALIDHLINQPRIQQQQRRISQLQTDLSNALARIDQLKITVTRQGESIKSFREYVAVQERRITNLEGNIIDIIRELENDKIQLKEKNLYTADIEKVLNALIEKAKRKLAEQQAAFVYNTRYLQKASS